MDIEHRRVLLAQLTERRRLAECPAVAQLAEQTCHMKHRKIGQMELVAELTAELVPHTREAAVFNKTADSVRKILARHVHHRGGSHRHAVEHHAWLILGAAEHSARNIYPAYYVLAVFPPHLYVVAVAESVGMQVGQQYVIPHAFVYACYGQHAYRAVFISVNQYGRAPH